MAEYLIQDTTLTALGNKIREKTGVTSTLTPDGTMLTELDKMADVSKDTVADSSMLSGVTAHNSSGVQVVGTIPTQAGKTVIPGTSSQTAVTSGVYTTGDVAVAGDANLVAENIAEGVNIFGVTGSHPSGVIVQVKSGTVTGVSSSNKAVDCGFKPDAVFFTGIHPYDNAIMHSGVEFYNSEITSEIDTLFVPPNTEYIFTILHVTQTSSGFHIRATRLDDSFNASNESNRTINYIAIKYT